MFDGSLIATISDGPARFTGITRCFSATSFGTSLMISGSISKSFRLIAGTPYCLREEVGELRLLDGAGLDQRGADAGAGLLLLLLRLAQLLDGDQVLADEQLTKATGDMLRSLPLDSGVDGHGPCSSRAGCSAVESSI